MKKNNSLSNNTKETENKHPQNGRKNYLIFGLLMSIIAVLLVGVIYQFVCIKKLQKQIDNPPAIIMIDNSFQTML